MPQPMKPATLPGHDGADLVPFLYYLREMDRDRYEVVLDALKTAFPDFEELNFPPVAAGMLAMTWKDKNFSKPMYMNELSEGTLRFLWLAVFCKREILKVAKIFPQQGGGEFCHPSLRIRESLTRLLGPSNSSR